MTDPAALPPFAPPPDWPAPPVGPIDKAPGRQQRPSLRSRWAPRHELRAGAMVVAVLAVVGVLLGVVWQWWSPPGPQGYIIKPGAIQPDETEAFIAADGRFAAIAVGVGLLAAIVVWWRKATRGPVAVAALALGGLVGAVLTALVGRWFGGGSSSGAANTLVKELPLTVHMRGLLLLEAAVAVLLYSMIVSFAVHDDLGNPDQIDDERDLGDKP